MNKFWLVATYKINEVRRIEKNLSNQQYKYYLPKIITKKINSSPKEVALFPGYIFIHTTLEKFSSLKYTKGIKKIIKFGQNISHVSEDEINHIRIIEEKSKQNPIQSDIQIGQEAVISKGSFKGAIVKICSLPSNKRIDILLSFLGSKRKITIAEENLIL